MSVFRVVESLQLGFFRYFSISVETVLILVSKSVKCPLAELIRITNVLSFVNKNEGFAFIVLVEYALKAVGGLFQELRPLRLEKLIVLNFDLVEVKTLECSTDGNCLEKQRVRYLT